MKKFAKAISFLLGPAFVMFPVPFILVEKFTEDYVYALKWAIFSYGFIVGAAISVGLGVLFGVFTNFDVSKREQRPLLFSILGLFMVFYLLSLIFLGAPKILFFGIVILIISLLIVVLVNMRIKASIHLAVLTSVLVLINIAYKGYFFFLFLLIPLLAWARIKAKGHTLLETIIGTILGLVITLVVYFASSNFYYE